MKLKSKITGKIINVELHWNKMNCSKCHSWSKNSKACDHFGDLVDYMNFCCYFIPNGDRMSKETILYMFECISQRYIKEEQIFENKLYEIIELKQKNNELIIENNKLKALIQI